MHKIFGIALSAIAAISIGASKASAHVVVDSNGAIVGELFGKSDSNIGMVLRNVDGFWVTIYVESDGFSNYANTLNNATYQSQIYYTTSDCSGTPYTLVNNIPYLALMVSATSPTGSMTVYSPSGSPVSETISSRMSSGTCYTTSSSGNYYVLGSTTLSFTPPFSIR